MINLTSLQKATVSLEKAVGVVIRKQNEPTIDAEELDTIKAGVIQNFEFTYEQSWKLMKRWIEENISSEAVDGVPRRELFRWAYESKLITDVELWMTFHKARNSSSHLYDEIIADEVFTASVSFLAVVKDLLSRLEQVT